MRPDVRRWSQRRTSRAAQWPLATLLAAKAASETTVSVVLPALNEAATIGAIVASLVRDLRDVSEPLIEEVVVIDSGSSDQTAAAARAAGARVLHREDVLPDIEPVPGKGEVLWRSLAATSGDVVVFIDADLRDFSSRSVTGLLGPLLTDPGIQLVKGCYDRPLRAGDTVLWNGGGRVTELVARPLLNLHWPELSGLIQPLVGEYAARRALLERLAFPTGYGVELAILIDSLALVGLDALAQVDLGARHHEHQDEQALGRMAAEIWHAAAVRLDLEGRGDTQRRGATLTQFARVDGDFRATTAELSIRERPPMAALLQERERRAS